MANIGNYISDSFNELKSNVTWPEWAEVQKYAIVVTVFTVIFSLAIWGVDTLFERLIATIYQLLNN